MNMKKTLLALSLVGCLLFAAVSCTDSNNPGGTDTNPVGTSEQVSQKTDNNQQTAGGDNGDNTPTTGGDQNQGDDENPDENGGLDVSDDREGVKYGPITPIH